MAKNQNATRRLLIWIIGCIVLLVILGVVGKVTGFLGGNEKGIEVEVATAEQRNITQVVTASGKVQPEVEVKISPDVSGEIIDLRVKEGDQVRQGELLARIKPDFYVAQVEQAQAGVSQSRANLARMKADYLKAEIDFNRQKGLYEKGVVSESDFQANKTQLEVARANVEAAEFAVESAEASLREGKEQLAKTSIYSPMTGTVSQLNVELGERVVGTSQMAGTEMMRIAKLDLMELEVDVNENDVVNVSVGDSATIEIDAYPERKFRGTVTEIANSARITNAGSQEQVTNFPVKVRILDGYSVDVGQLDGGKGAVSRQEVPITTADGSVLRPGMTGSVDVYSETVFNTISIPIQAVTVRDMNIIREKQNDKTAKKAKQEEKPEDGENGNKEADKKKDEDLRKVVFLVVNGKSKLIEVETGISDDTHVQVKSGLKGNETVIVGPYRAVSRELEPDADVRIKEEGNNRPATVVASAE